MLQSCRNVLASRGGYILIMALWIPSALYADANFDRWAQDVVSLVTWALLAAVFLAVDGHERRQLVVVVVVATLFEITFSIIWGLYVYRFENLPLYVPPGHGLIYLLALRLSQFPFVRASRLVTSGVVTVGRLHLGGRRAGDSRQPRPRRSLPAARAAVLPVVRTALARVRRRVRRHDRARDRRHAVRQLALGRHRSRHRPVAGQPALGDRRRLLPARRDRVVPSSRVWLARIPFGGAHVRPEPVTEGAG